MSASAPLFDTHCHLADAKLHAEACHLTGLAAEAGVGGLCLVMSDVGNLDSVPELAQTLRQAQPRLQIAWTAGLHPHEAKAFDPDLAQRLRNAALSAHAIGETGLDFHYNFSAPQIQEQVFSWHIDLACELQKPLVIHCREAKAEIFRLLNRAALRAHPRPGVLHCFTEDWDFAKQVLDLGLMISFSGILTFGKAEDLRQVARQVPLDRLLIETDSPYLAPKPHRGRSNQPAYVAHVFDCLKSLRPEPEDILREALWKNAERFFDLRKCS